MTDKPLSEFGRRRPASVPKSPAASPDKRSMHVALLVMGTLAVGGTSYALMPRECTPAQPGAAPGLSTPSECPPRSSSTDSGGSWRYSYQSGGSSGTAPAAATSDASSSTVKRGGFGSFAHSFASHFSFGS
jgi:hypothetical protein